MVYTIKIWTDGGCRNHGTPNAIGASAAVFETGPGVYMSWTRSLPSHPPPTSQRAEIDAINLALDQALVFYEELPSYTRLDVTIYSDSRYVVGCMTQWIPRFINNGWRNSAGRPVANRDLLEEAWYLNNELRQRGYVEYRWFPREQNQVADGLCDEEMDNHSHWQYGRY
ncbi:ribonuclease H1 [Penicillium waksmanii]|uniref:ribonuclease H1 n=1 Tax=Penicillium waksmanii TaxID=69791 RepID=UPI002546B486|nr:ribonuclease H1 [Penicillium waksmanii]KAJ5966278.1 ribonuclease H1 [Penicillium waksmanii]